MKLSDTVVEYQNSLLQLYRKLEERFEENSVIQALWRDMADDVSLQIQNLQALPASFWNRLKNIPNDDFESAVKNNPSPPEDVANISLRDCFEISLQLAEPVVLKIYARVVGLLRENPTAPALNFYILVKTYVTRLVRTTESFAGDPILTRRAQLLLAGLEKEAHESASKLTAPTPKTPKPRKTPVKTQKTSASSKTDVEAAKAAKKTTKASPQNVKPAASKPKKTAPAKSTLAKSAPVETKTLSGKRRRQPNAPGVDF